MGSNKNRWLLALTVTKIFSNRKIKCYDLPTVIWLFSFEVKSDAHLLDQFCYNGDEGYDNGDDYGGSCDGDDDDSCSGGGDG